MKKKQTLFADVLSSVTKYFLIAVVVVVLLILLSGFRVVESGNSALVLRFGKLVGDNYEEQVHEPGLLFALPYFIDEVVIVPTGSIQELNVTTHYTPDDQALSGLEGGYLITGDQNIVVVSASVKYMITDPVAYVTNVSNINGLIDAAVSTAMVSEAARLDVDAILTDGKDDFARAVIAGAAEKLEMMHTGVEISSLELTEVAPPNAVRSAFQEVNAASVSAETKVQQAETLRSTLRQSAYTTANSLKAAAKSEQSNKLAAANEELKTFRGVAAELATQRQLLIDSHAHADHSACADPEECAQFKAEYDKIKNAVFARIYSDRYTEAIGKIGKVYLVSDGGGKIVINP